jgi:hypothetical protein
MVRRTIGVDLTGRITTPLWAALPTQRRLVASLQNSSAWTIVYLGYAFVFFNDILIFFNGFKILDNEVERMLQSIRRD